MKKMTRWNRFIVPPGDASCTTCGESMSMAAPRCEECKRFTHVKCTEIPIYQLVHYFNSRIAYFCKDCMRAKYEDYDEVLAKIEDCMEGRGGGTAVDVSDSTANESETNGSSTEPSAPPASQVLTQQSQVLTQQSQRIASVAQQTRRIVEKGRTADGNGENSKRRQQNICRYYKKGSCKFGRKGNGCAYDHPQICVKFQRHGENVNGCRRGTKCDKFHPHICKYSSDGNHCGDERCKRLHLRSDEDATRTQKLAPVTQYRGSNRKFVGRYNSSGEQRERSAVIAGGQVLGERFNTAVNEDPFLGVREEMKWMREQMTKMMSMMEWNRGREFQSSTVTPPGKYQGHVGMTDGTQICRPRSMIPWDGAL